jgi:hypothetical protein
MTRALLVCLCVSLVACAALSRREKVKLSEDRLSRARALDAAHVAAEPFRNFEQALHSAEALPADAPEREEQLSVARLWLETAISEAETASLARGRLAIERETVRHDEAYLAAERERLAIEDERERALAAQIAREELTRALARAAENPSLRVKLSADETRRAAEALITRAELIALAIEPGTDSAAESALRATLDKARALLPKAPEQALTLADQALLSGLALVGRTRSAEAPPSTAQKAALAEALVVMGASVTRAEHGLSAALGNKVKETSLARLCGVARDYPAGNVQVVFGRGLGRTDPGGAPRLLEKHGCQGARFLAEQRSVEARGSAREQNTDAYVSFTFLAY